MYKLNIWFSFQVWKRNRNLILSGFCIIKLNICEFSWWISVFLFNSSNGKSISIQLRKGSENRLSIVLNHMQIGLLRLFNSHQNLVPPHRPKYDTNIQTNHIKMTNDAVLIRIQCCAIHGGWLVWVVCNYVLILQHWQPFFFLCWSHSVHNTTADLLESNCLHGDDGRIASRGFISRLSSLFLLVWIHRKRRAKFTLISHHLHIFLMFCFAVKKIINQSKEIRIITTTQSFINFEYYLI